MEPGPTPETARIRTCMHAKNDSPRVVDPRVSAGPCLTANAWRIHRIHDVVDGDLLGSSAARGVSILPFPLGISALRATSDIAVVSINQHATVYESVIRKAEKSFPGGRYHGSPVRPGKEFANSLINCQDGARTPRPAFPRISPFPSCHRLEPSQAKRQGQWRNETKNIRGRKEVGRARRTRRLCESARPHAVGVGCMTEPPNLFKLRERWATTMGPRLAETSQSFAVVGEQKSCKTGIEPMGTHASGPGLGSLVVVWFRPPSLVVQDSSRAVQRRKLTSCETAAHSSMAPGCACAPPLHCRMQVRVFPSPPVLQILHGAMRSSTCH